MTGTNKIILTIVLAAVLIIGVGYAAINSITLQITGQLAAAPSDANFNVKFINASPSDETADVFGIITGDLTATLNVKGLTAKGQTATATYTIQNTSEDLSASLTATATNQNTEYFRVLTGFSETNIAKGETSTLTVTVELIKTPIDAEVTDTVGIKITASPVQPQ